MEIYVRAEFGFTTITVNWNDTIAEIKNQIEREFGIDSSRQKLIFNQRELANTSTFSGNNLQKHVVLRLRIEENRSQSKQVC